MNEQAVERMMVQTGQAEESLKVISQFIENHGNVLPEDVNWNHVGTMAHLVELLDEAASFIQS